jgi:hypothetical protein
MGAWSLSQMKVQIRSSKYLEDGRLSRGALPTGKANLLSRRTWFSGCAIVFYLQFKLASKFHLLA